jgi:spermidine synthase
MILNRLKVFIVGKGVGVSRACLVHEGCAEQQKVEVRSFVARTCRGERTKSRTKAAFILVWEEPEVDQG